MSHLIRNRYARFIYSITTVVIAMLLSGVAAAQKFDEKFEHWPTDLKINGRILVDNGIEEFDGVKRILNRIVKDNKVIVLAGKKAGDSKLVEVLSEGIGDDGAIETTQVDKDLVGQLKKAVTENDVVVFLAGDELAEGGHDGKQIQSVLREFIRVRGALIVDARTGEMLSKYYLSSDDAATFRSGLNLLPDCILNCKYDSSDSTKSQILSVVAAKPGSVGIGLETGTLLMLSGRKITCYGKGKATFMLMATEHLPLRVESIIERSGRRQNPSEYLVDLTEWRRDAIDRTLAPFPPAEPETPNVENGTLVIIGGGGMPDGMMGRFIELAGGVENAKLVYVPCSEADEVNGAQRMVQGWKRMGVKQATFIHTKDRIKANTDEEFFEPLKEATGIFFGGGRQWNFADSYYGTKTHELMKQVLHRGGVIAGSSAGASIQGRYLARATPIGNFRIMAPGYERGGLGFLSGVAIDQHFSQRGRQKDMTQLVNRYPQLLGIGLDEATAIVVQKSTAEIVGRGKVHFYDRNLPVYPDRPDYIALSDGSSFDLAKREVLVDSSDAETEEEKESESKDKE